MNYIAPDNYDVMHKVFKTYGIYQRNKGCEVGVRHGFFSEYLLQNNHKLKMICVDPYPEYMDRETLFTLEMQNEIKASAKEKLSVFNNRAKWNYLPSTDAAQYYDDGFFDFVFIDSEHTYEALKADLSAWARTVRPGGLLCGHDKSMDGVSKALLEYTDNGNAKPLYFSPPDQADCWWIPM